MQCNLEQLYICTADYVFIHLLSLDEMQSSLFKAEFTFTNACCNFCVTASGVSKTM